MSERNALAELAERLRYHDCQNDDFYSAVEKAHRIVAELAKFEPGRIFGGRFDVNSLLNLETVYEACRMIAEEGAGDGRQES